MAGGRATRMGQCCTKLCTKKEDTMTLTTQQTSVEVDHFNQPAEMERKFDREREKTRELTVQLGDMERNHFIQLTEMKSKLSGQTEEVERLRRQQIAMEKNYSIQLSEKTRESRKKGEEVGRLTEQMKMIAFFAWLPFLLALLLVITVSYLTLLCRIRQISKNLSNSSERCRRRSQRFTVTAFIVTVVSFTAWLPFMIMSAINLFVEINDDARIVNPVKLLHFFNSLGNPIIYWLRLPHFKVSVYELLSRCRPKTQADHSVQIMNGFVTSHL